MLRSARSTLIAVGLVLGGIAAAVAANTTFFTSIGDLVFPFTPPTASAPGSIDNMTLGATTPRAVTGSSVTGVGSVRGALLLGPWGTYVKNPASLTSYPSYSLGNDQAELLFSATGTTSYAYITLAAAPLDGMRQCYFSDGAITTLYVYANTGQTIANAATALLANVRNCYTYSTSNTKWDRSQ